MKMETINRIRQLTNSAKSLRSFPERYREETSKTSCDKYGCGFGDDPRFSHFDIKTQFSSHKGYYGNSNCGRFSLNVASDDAQKYLVAAMNKHLDILFQTMADMMEKDARKLIDSGKKEIEEAEALMQSVLETEEDQP